MSADGVAQQLDIVTRFLPTGVDLFANLRRFQQLEEALGHRAIVAVSSLTHVGMQVEV
jgi:hypothetical protein